MSNELQKYDVIKQGGLGEVVLNGRANLIIKSKSNYMEGTLTLTISPINLNKAQVTEDAEFEILPPKQLTNK